MSKNEQAIYIMKIIDSCIDPVQLLACNSLIMNFHLIHEDLSIRDLLLEIMNNRKVIIDEL